MNFEDKSNTVPIKPEQKDRTQVFDEVFKRYHSELLSWARYKLYINGGESKEAEDVVSILYKQLLANKNLVDLDRPDWEVGSFLNTALSWVVDAHVKRNKKRKISILPIDEIIENSKGKDFPTELQQYLSENPDPDKAILIEEVLTKIGKRNPKMEDVLRKRYQLGLTLQEISDMYGQTKQNIEVIQKIGTKYMKGIISGRVRSDLTIPRQRDSTKGLEEPMPDEEL